jgi:broad specificity phosphatase PhoE
LFCKDKKWKVPSASDDDPGIHFPKDLGGYASSSDGGGEYREKTIILIRHGESTWNDTFNPGHRNKVLFILLFLPNLLYAVLVELYYFVSGRDSDSWFYDSPLSNGGKSQIVNLRSFLKKESLKLGGGSSSNNGREDKAIRILLALGEKETHDTSSHVVTSNLRRAISTTVIGLADRFVKTMAANNGDEMHNNDDQIILLPSLQEISTNPDALSILPPRGVAQPTWCDIDIPGLPQGQFTSLVNTKYHTGNKRINSNGLQRLEQFVLDVFDDTKLPKSNIIAVGHSLFFRSLFKVYLPRQTVHTAKDKKMVNGGAVMLTMREVTTMTNTGSKKKKYMIDPGSIVVIYGGFGKHTKG